MKNDTAVLPGKPIFKSIILIDDDVRTERIISTVFRQFEFAITCTSNWREGIEVALAQNESAKIVPLVLVNLNMPELAGWSAIWKLRDSGFDEPIVALTKDDPQKFIGVGCDDVLRKPINHDSLLMLVEKYSLS